MLVSDCQPCLTAFAFHSVLASGHGHQPFFGVHPGSRWVHPRITHSCGLGKNGTVPPFIFWRRFKCFMIMEWGSNNRENVCIKG